MHYIFGCLLLVAPLFCKGEQELNKPVINDFSRLNRTSITRLATPASYEELALILQEAQKKGLKIAIAGSKHSQGGHAFYPDAIVISLKKLNKVISFDHSSKTVTVQAGATWKELQAYLNPHNRAVKIMQFANFFTIGGALSVNANGIDPQYGPLIESVRSITIMQPDGTLIKADRTTNTQLFSLAIGGYGLFGIILEVTLEVVDNSLYRRRSQSYCLRDYINHLKTTMIDKKRSNGFHLAFIKLKPHRKKLFGGVLSIDYCLLDEKNIPQSKRKRLRTLKKEYFVSFKKKGINLLRESSLIKSIAWIPELALQGKKLSRNAIMSPAVSHIYSNQRTTTDLLQEYFIPLEQAASFIEHLEEMSKRYSINIMHVALRFIPKNTESFLSYTKDNVLGIVIFFSRRLNDLQAENVQSWTRSLIDKTIALKGAYYLPVQLHARHDQIKQVYPEIDNFFALKKQYDPSELLVNHFYKKYA